MGEAWPPWTRPPRQRRRLSVKRQRIGAFPDVPIWLNFPAILASAVFSLLPISFRGKEREKGGSISTNLTYMHGALLNHDVRLRMTRRLAFVDVKKLRQSKRGPPVLAADWPVYMHGGALKGGRICR